MTEKAKTLLFLTYLDRMLAGESIPEPAEDQELARLIETAQALLYRVDFSADSKVRESLRLLLREHISGGNALVLEEGELTDEELSYTSAAAGGYLGERCPFCGDFVRRGEACSRCRTGK